MHIPENILAVIPARAGSKGIPDKNIRPLGGVPLLVHSIRHALQAGFLSDDILLTTDSEQYAAIGREAGATVPFLRPQTLSTDRAGSREVMLHAVDAMNERAVREKTGRRYDTICLLQPTSPLRRPEDIIQAIRLYQEHRPDMVVGVRRSPANPYYNLFETDTRGHLHISKGDGLITRRQDAPTVYEFNGAIYIINAAALRRCPITLFPEIIPYEMPEERSIDLDTPDDWQRAEAIFNSEY